MKPFLVSVLVFFSFHPAFAAELSRRDFLATSACALFVNINSGSQDLGLEWYVRTQMDANPTFMSLSQPEKLSLYEEIRWSLWDQIQQAALAHPDEEELLVSTEFSKMIGAQEAIHLQATFKIFTHGFFNDPQRGRESRITKISYVRPR